MSFVLSEPGRIWRLTLSRPEARNAVSSAILAEIEATLSASAQDPDCRVIVLAGAGKDFCAGADVGELLAAREGQGATEYGQRFEATLGAIQGHPRPVVAAMQDLAARIATLAPLSITASKRGIQSVLAGLARRQHEEFDAEAERALASQDLLEGLRAFRERRHPAFQGR
jgi:enoyl-CoA hydratase/carnithine racemase